MNFYLYIKREGVYFTKKNWYWKEYILTFFHQRKNIEKRTILFLILHIMEYNSIFKRNDTFIKAILLIIIRQSRI
jgi:hypothetical protein